MSAAAQHASAGRCPWCEGSDLYRNYHDHEWGFPVADETRVFEKLCLEGFQAGLAWITILRKREAFRAAFAGFEIGTVAGFGESDIGRLLGDAGIVRHRGKIEAAIHNAGCALRMHERGESVAGLVWQHEPRPSTRPARVTREWLATMTRSPESEALSRALKARGWKFVGPTTLYAMMQSLGVVNDHEHTCPARSRALAARAAFTPPSIGRARVQ